jgi:hypothetical protein
VHAQGLVHGRITPSSVLLDDDGRPMLADTGVASLVELAERSTTPADDVRDLALMCRAALVPGAVASPLAAVLAAATADDATRRPSVTQLAAAIYATGPASAIRPGPETARPAPWQSGQSQSGAPSAALQPVGPRSHRRTSVRLRGRAGRRWAVLLVSLAAAAAAALTGLAWAGVDASAPGSTVTSPVRPSSYDDHDVVVASPTDRWRSVLVALDARRATAFAAAAPGRLSAVDAAGSPALRRDGARLSDLAASGLHVERLRLRPQSLRLAAASTHRVVLTVVDVLEPYELRTSRGSLVATRSGRGATTWRVTLVHRAAGWRIFDVVAT